MWREVGREREKNGREGGRRRGGGGRKRKREREREREERYMILAIAILVESELVSKQDIHTLIRRKREYYTQLL